MLNVTTWQRTPWSVFDELEWMQEDMTRLLGEGVGRRGWAWRDRESYPPMNVWSSPEGLMMDAELPGVDPKDVEISVVGDQLTLRGKVNTEDAAGETYYRRERPRGEFSRTIQLPFRADAGAVKATYKNGILRLAVPRSEAEKPRTIQIET